MRVHIFTELAKHKGCGICVWSSEPLPGTLFFFFIINKLKLPKAFLQYFHPSCLNMAPHVCTLGAGTPSCRPDVGYMPKHRVEDPLLALVVDGASVSRAVLRRHF
jgi:hypothetical protein